MNKAHCNNVIRCALAVKFSRVFALSLSRFFTNGAGFDAESFGATLFTEAKSLEESVRGRYGEEGLSILQKLIGVAPLSDSEKDEAATALGRYYVASVCDFHDQQFTAA